MLHCENAQLSICKRRLNQISNRISNSTRTEHKLEAIEDTYVKNHKIWGRCLIFIQCRIFLVQLESFIMNTCNSHCNSDGDGDTLLLVILSFFYNASQFLFMSHYFIPCIRSYSYHMRDNLLFPCCFRYSSPIPLSITI